MGPIQGRRGERIVPEHLDEELWADTNRRLDEISAEEPLVPGVLTGLLVPRPVRRRRSHRDVLDLVLQRVAHVLAVLALLVLVGLLVGEGMGWLA